MIIIFHAFIKFCLSLAHTFKLKNTQIKRFELISRDAEADISFDPPVYRQRYGAVHSILRENPWKKDIRKIVDFGCAEFHLIAFVNRFYRINEILAVDIDYDLLKDNLFRLRPVIYDYLSRRPGPLDIHVYQGSISDPDDCLLGTDVVICIELIEHLYPNDLDALPYNVFGFIKPKIAIFTTPNADFNVLFPNFKAFRHADHKFEWSREQFELWAINLTTRFPDYSVTFKGIGEGPIGTEHLGCCSQMAVFVKNRAESIDEGFERTSFGVCRYNCYSDLVYSSAGGNGNYYTFVETIEYPYEQDDRSIEQKLLHELQYGIQLRSKINGQFYNETSNRCEIPLPELVFNYRSNITTESEAREILENANYKIEQCTICDRLETCVVLEPEMEESRSSTPVTSSDITDSSLDDSNVDWNSFNLSDEDPWGTKDECQNAHLNDTRPDDSSEAVQEVVNHLVNNLNLIEDKSKFSNGINLFIANDTQKLNSFHEHEHERKLKPNLKSHTLVGRSEAGPSYAKKRRKKLHEDDDESLQDVFKNAEIDTKLENIKIIEISDSDGEDLQDVAHSAVETIKDAVDLEVEVASREALFDPNSVIELSDLDELVNETNNQSIEVSPNVVVIGISIDPEADQLDGPVLPLDADPFPNWLLHMLGAEVVVEDISHDEPHFYCQGDGVVAGVHPSFMEGEFEEDPSSSGSDNSTSNASSESVTISNDVAEAEPTISEVEVISLPDDNRLGVVDPAVIVIQEPVPINNSSEASDDFYDTANESVPSNNSVTDESKNATTSNKK